MAQGPAHASNMENLREEVQRVCSGTSDRFVPEPSRSLFKGTYSLQWEGLKIWLGGKNFGATKTINRNGTTRCKWRRRNSRFKATGLNTGLKPTFGIKNAKHGSDNLEGFLTAAEKTLPKEAFKRWRFERQNTKTKEIYVILQRLNPDLSV